jgi:hypothetical protein
VSCSGIELALRDAGVLVLTLAPQQVHAPLHVPCFMPAFILSAIFAAAEVKLS